MGQLRSGAYLHHLAGQVTGRAVTDGSERQRTRLFLRHRNQLLYGIRRELRVGDEDLRQRTDNADRFKVARGVEAQLGKYRGINGVRRKREQHRVAVGRRPGHHFGADRATRSAAVVDHDRLAKRCAQTILDDSRDDVGTAARRIRHNETDRLVRIRACLRKGRAGHQHQYRSGDGSQQ